MNDATQSVSLPNLFALLRRHLLLITLTVMIAVGASLGLSAATEPTYSASAQVGFNDDSADLQALGIPASPSFQPDKEAAAQAERITRPDVIDEVRRELKTNLSTAAIQSAVDTQLEIASNLVSIKAEAETGDLAAGLANGFAAAIRDDSAARSSNRYQTVARTSQRRADRLKGEKNAGRRAVYEDQAARLLALAAFAKPVEIVRTASVPENPSSPKPVRDAVLAGVLGAILALALAFLRNAFDRRLREQGDVEEHMSAPVLGSLRTAALGKTPLPAGGKKQLTKDEDIEPFRILRTNIGFLSVDKKVKTVLVTSPLPEEGKSTVAAGLAWAEAMTGRRTLLVDCDLRRPTVADRLGVDNSPGLSDFLVGDAEPADILRTVDAGAARAGGEGHQLVCIPAGRAIYNHAELLESDRFREFLTQVSEVYDRVVLDSAPILPVSDTLALLPQVDGIMLCVRLGQTTRDEAIAATAAFERFPATPVGLVLTAADTSSSPYYVGSYAYSGRSPEAVG